MSTVVPASVWRTLAGLDVYQVHEIPRPSADNHSHSGGCSSGDEQRIAALVSAYHADAGPVLVGWYRPSPTGPVAVYIGGAGLADTQESSGHAVVSLPAGGHARRLPTGAIADALAVLPCWTPIAGITDGLLTDHQLTTGSDVVLRPSLEEGLLTVWRQVFAWLVIAEPVTSTDLDELITQVGNQYRDARAKAGSSPDYAVKTQRLERRHRELCQAVSTGLWRTHFVAGATSPTAAIRIAALVCASTDLGQLPYVLAPGGNADRLETILDTETSIRGGSAPFHATTPLVAAIAKPPALEIPGVHFRLRPEFDVTPETSLHGEGSAEGAGLRLGDVLDRNRMTASPMWLSRSSLNRHTFVCGATGAGKSQTIRGLLEACTTAGLPWLVIEPAKAEYRLMATRLADTNVIVIRPGDADALPAGINPLEPAFNAGRRYPLQTHADLVRALFLAAFESHEPFPQVLSAALTRCYEQSGWDLALGQPRTPDVTPRYPTLADLHQAAEQVVDEIGYSKQITDDIRGFIRVRLSSLRLGTTGRFFEGGHPLNFDALLNNNVIFEIEDIGDDRDKAFLIGTVLIRLIEHLRLQQRHHGGIAMPLRHITVIEEAHRLLRRTEESGPAAHAVEMFAGLLAEIRAYGEGLIIAEQIPSKLLPDVIKNTAIKIVHRLPAHDDRDTVGATMNITTTQSDYLVTLPPGHAAVFTDGMDYPLLVAMQDGTKRETSNPATPANPTQLVTPRSPICGNLCHQRPCTVCEICNAKDHIEDNPRLTLWIELLTIAHLVGKPAPRPDKTWLDDLKTDTDRRTLECAISHCIQTAINNRYTGLAAYYQPDALAIHLATCTVGLLDDTTPPCDGTEIQWQAGRYRWIDVHRALRNSTSAKDQPHTDTEAWARRGLHLTGQTQAQQLKQLQNHPDYRQPPRTIITGIETPPTYDTALAQLSDEPDPKERFLNATRFLNLGTTWPLEALNIGDSIHGDIS